MGLGVGVCSGSSGIRRIVLILSAHQRGVIYGNKIGNRLNGFPSTISFDTGLKPGENEKDLKLLTALD